MTLKHTHKHKDTHLSYSYYFGDNRNKFPELKFTSLSAWSKECRHEGLFLSKGCYIFTRYLWFKRKKRDGETNMLLKEFEKVFILADSRWVYSQKQNLMKSTVFKGSINKHENVKFVTCWYCTAITVIQFTQRQKTKETEKHGIRCKYILLYTKRSAHKHL